MKGFPLASYYGKHTKCKPIRTGHLPPLKKAEKKEEPKKTPAPKPKPLDDFEAEYQAFITALKAKKENEK